MDDVGHHIERRDRRQRRWMIFKGPAVLIDRNVDAPECLRHRGRFRDLDIRWRSCHAARMEKIAIKRPLETEGVPALIEDRDEALAVFEAILERGRSFYPDADEASPRRSRVCRVVPLAES